MLDCIKASNFIYQYPDLIIASIFVTVPSNLQKSVWNIQILNKNLLGQKQQQIINRRDQNLLSKPRIIGNKFNFGNRNKSNFNFDIRRNLRNTQIISIWRLVECSPMVRETGVQSQVVSYERL